VTGRGEEPARFAGAAAATGSGEPARFADTAAATGSGEPAHLADTAHVQELVRECILFGLLFKAAMLDLAVLRTVPLKLSYRVFFEKLSWWAEKKHHQLRASLRQQGCELLIGEKREGSLYCVQIRVNGYVQEIYYSTELLRAECEKRVQQWITER